MELRKSYIKHNQYINQTDSNGNTLLMHLVRENELVLVEELLKREKLLIDYKNNNDESAFNIAISLGDSEMINLLLKCDELDVNEFSKDITPLMRCVLYKDVKLIEMLIKREDLKYDIRDRDGNTAMDIARDEECDEIIEILREYYE